MLTTENGLVIIGGGPAGLAAAVAANKAGVAADDILIIERDRELGGILNQCIHAGFGLHMFGEELTGPEYAGRFIAEVTERGIGYVTDSMVLSLSEDRTVSVISPKLGFTKIKAGAVILAMGCRERTRGALVIPGTRPAGVFSAGTAQRFVNIEGKAVGKKIVILGSGDIGLIMARRLTLEGAEVVRVCEIMPYSGGLARNIEQCLNDFGIPLYLSHTVTRIDGRERIEGVVISKVDEKMKPIPGSEEYVECDTLLLSVGLIPENELTKDAGITLDRVTGGAVVNQYNETSASGIFACGNVLQVHDLVDFVTKEAYTAGEGAAKFIKSGRHEKSGSVSVSAGKGVRYAVPQTVAKDGSEDGVKLFFRVSDVYKNVSLAVYADGALAFEVKKKIVRPGEMETVQLPKEIIGSAGEIKLEIKTEE